MKKLVLWTVLILVSQGAFAQTVAEIQKMMSDENISGARKMARELIQKEPSNGDGYYYLGETFYFDEAQDSAAFWYNKGLALAPESPAPHVGVGKIALDKGLTQDAEKSFGRALRFVKKKPAEAYALIGSAYLTCQKPNVDKALENFTLARDNDTKNPRYFMLLGDALVSADKIGEAQTNYTFASEKDKDNPEILMKIARTYLKSGIPDVGQKNLEDIIAKFPSYSPAYKDLYEIYFSKQLYTKGTPLLTKYVELVGNDIDARARLVRFLTGFAKDFDRALTEAKIVLQQDPNRGEMYRWIAWAAYEKGAKLSKEEGMPLFKESFEASKMFFEKEPNRKKYSSDYEYYAKAAAKIGEVDIAAQNYMKIVEMDSTRTEVYDVVGKTYYDSKNYQKALDTYSEKIQKVTPTNQDFFYIGNCQMQLKNYALADSAYKKVNELNPTYAAGWYTRARINVNLDSENEKKSMAKPYFEKFIELVEPTLDKADQRTKSNVIAAYAYLGEYFAKFVDPADYPKSLQYFEKIAALDPANASVQETINNIKAAMGNKN
jgi:tetratricopeptide (TPR) repeat protein